ncbi:MAG: glutamate synthase large subunit [Deferribacteraceae bacterium]|jgi:glutamate synthase (NADPH/NADH) large chain|nr:glutamate synthase large subunit [Deferribacteraceae bacterium]
MNKIREFGLYTSLYEHDSCGVGIVADINNIAAHKIVEDGLYVLKNLTHRGAIGGDALTGDGAGILVSLPDAFFRKFIKLPKLGEYAVAMLFNADGGVEVYPAIEKIVADMGGKVIGWRDVPTDASGIGKVAQQTCPKIRQLFVDGSAFNDREEFERKLFVMRRKIEKEHTGLYFPSFSSKKIVYKGMLMATQIEQFYPDLLDESFASPIALVHQRFSTNTFPTWELAQPFRYLAHNGEINTLRGNLNHLASREPHFKSELFGDDIKELLPLVKEGQSDSACLDNIVEMLYTAGRDICHTMLMTVPQAWGEDYYMGRDLRGFYEYHTPVMEPWDGPAALAFSDGINAGAMLDRNGLRPLRYALTKDNLFVIASEAGVLPIPTENVAKRGRIAPGEIIYCDLENRRILFDKDVKKIAARKHPYRRWVDENKLTVDGLFTTINPSSVKPDLIRRQRLFSYTKEDLEMILAPMAENGIEPTGSMGNDAALAVLSKEPQILFGYFKQLFAQVTNPPIDPIREELVMSLATYIGNKGNILEETALHAKIIRLERPILTDDEIERIKSIRENGFRAVSIPIAFTDNLQKALDALGEKAVKNVQEGKKILILSDKDLGAGQLPIPSLLAAACVNKALIKAKLRPEAGIILETGEAREVMHFVLLLGYGVTAINPYLALESISELVKDGTIQKDIVSAAGNYIKAVGKGILKTMSKMGISTLRSYRSAQLFEAVGLSKEVIDRYFTNTASRIGGLNIEDIQTETIERVKQAYENNDELPSGGKYKFRKDGEQHLWTPETMVAFRQGVQTNNLAKYREFASYINDQSGRLCTLRGLFNFAEREPISLDRVEPAENIMKRFIAGAMSMGALSPEAHETIAIALNKIGGLSNSGEGGEDPERLKPGPNGENRASAVRQVASGRFGVTIEYLAHAKELQIKIAQGAKPGEGGQLPGHKVNHFIAKLRHSTPFVTLISPPPHHDIYSIEDLAQLIFDLRNANPKARISVKLVSEMGVGTIAAGVAKAHSDMILISGHDGGTGASPLSSIKHAGLPWELGLAETQQTLVLNNLRNRVRLQVDGQIKTGRDVVIAALLGAEEFGFGTTVLACIGCIMVRKCHDNRCPTGVATQDASLRKRFAGKPEYIENYFRFVAEEVRETLASLGLSSIDEAVGRSDLLRMADSSGYYKTRNLDFSKIFAKPEGDSPTFKGNDYSDFISYDREFLIPEFAGVKLRLKRELNNTNRAVGAELSYKAVREYPPLKEDTVVVDFTGCAGQSFGAFLAPGITLRLSGEANDFVGKGISGGKIIIRTPEEASYVSSENSIVGNIIAYGGTSGKIFINGRAGERFAIRNSGVTIVAEGVGDHGCEYMTGGTVLILGMTGVNFGAGMTGGFAYVLDENGDFDLRCNMNTIDLENITTGSEDEAVILSLLNEHYDNTLSAKAKKLLDNWQIYRDRFVKVFPIEYRIALEKAKAAEKK